MPYTIRRSNGTTLANISDQSIDSSACSLNLVGKGAIKYGQPFSENFAYLLENFANDFSPIKPMIGQFWYDTSSQTIKIYNGSVWNSIGAFGNTGDILPGKTIAGNTSSNDRDAGTIGYALSYNNKFTTVSVTLAEGKIISIASNEAIPYNSLPATIIISGFTIILKSRFPNGIVAGLTLATDPNNYEIDVDTSGLTNQIDELSINVSTLTQNVLNLNQTLANSAASISQEATVRATADAALASEISTLTASIGTANSTITIEETVRASADAAMATELTTLTAQINGNIAALSTELTVRSTADSALATEITTLTATVNSAVASITTEETVRGTADSALAQQISSINATFGAVNANITSEQTARATADTAIAQSVTTLTATVNSNTAAITNEQTARATADSALSTSITNLTATVNTNASSNTAAITNEQTARANADGALAQSITNLTATVNGIDGSSNTAAIQAEATARATADTAISTTVSTLTATVNTNASTAAAAISTEQTARATGDTALATSISTLSTSVGGNTASILSLTSSVNGIAVKYAMEGTINGVTGGFIFSGVQQVGGGAVFNMEFDSNVTINGTLLVNGTVSSGAIANQALTCFEAFDGIGNGVPTVITGWENVTNTTHNSSFHAGVFTVGDGDQGLYIMSGMVTLYGSVQDLVLEFYYNGSTPITYGEGFTPGQNDTRAVGCCSIHYMNAGDSLEAVVYQANASGNFEQGMSYAFLSIYRLST